MGSVYLAVRTADGMEIALKVLHPHLAVLPRFVKRFHKEAKLLEKLAHPKVARVIESGVGEGVFFIAMELAQGEKLSERIEKHARIVPIETLEIFKGRETDKNMKLEVTDPLPVSAVIKMMRQVAAVLEEARQLGLVHRDIKPDNIIIDDDFNIKLLDFGIVKDTKTADALLSFTGQTLGTPPYMSPEQCAGDSEIDTRSDLYSLGIVAYHCLCGHLPFTGPTAAAYIRQHTSKAPRPLIQANPKIPRNFSLVVDRLLAKDPNQRHQTPSELIEDLNRIERGEQPIVVFSSEKDVLRKRKLAVTVLTALIICALCILFYSRFMETSAKYDVELLEEEVRSLAENGEFHAATRKINNFLDKHSDRYEVIKELSVLFQEIASQWKFSQNKYNQAFSEGRSNFDAKRYEKALELFKEAYRHIPAKEATTFIEITQSLLIAENQARLLLEEIQTLISETDYMAAAQKANEGMAKYSETAYGSMFGEYRRDAEKKHAESLDNKKQKWETHYNSGLLSLERNDLRGALFSFEEASKYDDTDESVDAAESVRKKLKDYEAGIEEGRLFLQSDGNEHLALKAFKLAQKSWDNQEVRTLIDSTVEKMKTGAARIAVCEFDVLGSDNEDIGSQVTQMAGARLSSGFTVISQAELTEYLGESGLSIPDLSNPRKSAGFRESSGVKYAVFGTLTFQPKLTLEAKLVDVETGKTIQRAQAESESGERIEEIVEEAIDVLLMSTAARQDASQVEANYKKLLEQAETALRDKRYDDAGLFYKKALSVKDSSTVKERLLALTRIHRAQNVKVLRELQGHAKLIRSVVFSTTGRFMASASDDRTVKIWNYDAGLCLHDLKGHDTWVLSTSFSPDNELLATASLDMTVRIWNPGTGEAVRTLKTKKIQFWSVLFRPDGDALAAGGSDGLVRLWSPRSGEVLHSLEGHSDNIRSLAFSSDGVLASGGNDKTIRLWTVDTGEALRMFKGHEGAVYCLAFNPKGNFLASAGEDKTIRIWDAKTGECIRTLQDHEGKVWSVAFSPDGSLLASASQDKSIRIWNPESGVCLSKLDRHAGPVFSVTFNPTGRVLASAGADKKIILWDIPAK